MAGTGAAGGIIRESPVSVIASEVVGGWAKAGGEKKSRTHHVWSRKDVEIYVWYLRGTESA